MNEHSDSTHTEVSTADNSTEPAPTSPGNGRELAAAVQAVATAHPGHLADQLTPEQMQAVITQLLKGYLVKREDGEDFLPASPEITATEASVAASGVMSAAGLEFFELTLWNSWGRVQG